MGSVVSLDLHALYAAEVDAVHSFLASLGLRSSELEDAVHDTFLTAMNRRDTFDASKPARPWLLGIAFRVMVARRRRMSTAREVVTEFEEDDAPESAQGSPELALEEKRRRALVQRAVSELPEEQATVFVLYELRGVGAAEISETMQSPLATTYSRLRLARVAFNAAVERLTHEERT